MSKLKRKKRTGHDVSVLDRVALIDYEDIVITREERDRFERIHAIGPIHTPGNNREDRPLASKERENLLRTISSLALLLIENQRGEKYGTEDKPNVNALRNEIVRLVDAVGASTEGQSKSTLYQVIPQAVHLVLKE